MRESRRVALWLTLGMLLASPVYKLLSSADFMSALRGPL